MPAKKPSAKATKAAKTVSPKPAARSAAKTKAKPKAKAAARTTTAKAAARPKATKTPRKAAAPASKAKRKASRGAAGAAEAADTLLEAAEAAEVEALEAGMSLLSGPRNVQPYVARKGEEYMSKEQLDHFRNILLTWKQDLMQEVDRTMLHMKDEAANFPDPNDRATQESEFSLELRTRDRERKLIRKIDEALKRIDDGSYGFCLETGEPIGVKRLEARPVATLSVEAQERRERREKQFGDRDDWYR
jgi:DnaK suppressor protein